MVTTIYDKPYSRSSPHYALHGSTHTRCVAVLFTTSLHEKPPEGRVSGGCISEPGADGRGNANGKGGVAPVPKELGGCDACVVEEGCWRVTLVYPSDRGRVTRVAVAEQGLTPEPRGAASRAADGAGASFREGNGEEEE